MTLALDRLQPASIATAWTVQPLAVVVAVLLVAAYARGVVVLRRRGRTWPGGRVAVFGVGVLVFVYASCGLPQVYGAALYWVWTSQALGLWLVVPILLLLGHPVQLARELGGAGGAVDRVLQTRPVRVVSSPLVGPALVPILSFALFFGPLAGWAIATPALGWVLQLVLVLIGAAMVLPLAGLDDDARSLAVGLSLAIGSFELVLDALPGIVLRLKNDVATDWFTYRSMFPWSPSALSDQHLAGSILWSFAEVIDLPYLFLVYRRWLRADARDAADVDAVLEAERAARRALAHGTDATPGAGAADGTGGFEADRDEPWWLSDPGMQERLRRRR